MRFQALRPAYVVIAVLAMLATPSGLLAQNPPDPATCYVLDDQFARQFDWLAIGFAALAALFAPVVVVYFGLARRFWWAAHPVGRWCVICAFVLFTFLLLWIALPVLSLLGIVGPELGLRSYPGLSPLYLQCTSVAFASRGFLFSALSTGQAPSIVSWTLMLVVTALWFFLFAAAYWLWARLKVSRQWS